MNNSCVLEVRGLEKAFSGQPVLKGISFNVMRGSTVSVIGPSGSGKSTIARCVCGLESFEAGEVLIGGDPVSRLRGNPRRLCRHVGMIFQQFNLWPHFTSLENVAFAPRKSLGLGRAEAEDLASRLLKRVGLAGKEHRKPRDLSGGEQQRVAIARALALSPDLLVFDEPTSALDPELVGEVLAVMRDLAAEGVSMLVITHEMQFAREASDQVIFIADGLIQEQGPPEQLFTQSVLPRTRAFLARFNTRDCL